MLCRGFLTARATVSSLTDLPPASRSARAPKHPVSPQLSIHHLPVKRVHCQLDCPEVWQKRNALTPIVPPDSALACPVAPACPSAAPLCAAIRAFLPGAWRVAQLGCTPAPVSLAMQRYWNHHIRRQPITLRFHQFGQPLRKPPPPTARSARISTARSPAPPRPNTLQSFAPCRRHKFCPSKPGRAAAPPLSASIPAGAARKFRMRYWAPVQNDEKHSSQMGTRLVLVSSRSQIRQPAGKSTLTTASLISASQPRPGRGQPCTPPRRAPATQPELYSSSRFN